MNLIRISVALIGGLLIVCGYTASQLAFFSGSTKAYSLAVETSPIWLISLIVLGFAVVVGVVGGSPESESEDSE